MPVTVGTDSDSTSPSVEVSKPTPEPTPDWSAPETKKPEANGFDAFDWSAPVGRDEPTLDLQWSDDDDDDEDDDEEERDEERKKSEEAEKAGTETASEKPDIAK